jgi:curved DNA-binding protein CbpA
VTADGPDPYKTLQVDPEAEDEVIQAAYRRLARKYHPDLAPGEEAAARMAAINAAWELIGDPAARAAFDRRRAMATRRRRRGGDVRQEPRQRGRLRRRRRVVRPRVRIRTRPTATRDRLARLDVGAVVVRQRL